MDGNRGVFFEPLVHRIEFDSDEAGERVRGIGKVVGEGDDLVGGLVFDADAPLCGDDGGWVVVGGDFVLVGDAEEGIVGGVLQGVDGDVELGIIRMFPDVERFGRLDDDMAFPEDLNEPVGWERFERAFGCQSFGEVKQAIGR